jgi:hypothetical protein
MKQYILSIIFTYIFCLTAFTLQADNSHETFVLQDSANQNKGSLAEVAKMQRDNIKLNEERTKTYPNPVYKGGLLTIEIPKKNGELTVSLYNTVGKVIQTFKTSNKKIEITAPSTSGIYVLRFVEKQKVIAVEKIIVKE